MQRINLTPQQRVNLRGYLEQDRQWKREHRISFARLMLKYAHAKNDAENVQFYRAVIQANTL